MKSKTKQKLIRIIEISFIPCGTDALVLMVIFVRKPNKQEPRKVNKTTLSSPDDLDQSCSLDLPGEIESKVKKINFLNEASGEKSYILKH